MDLDRPFTALTTSVDGDVLRALTLREHVLTSGDVHRMCGRHSLEGVRRSLARLASMGIVDMNDLGPVHGFALNPDHLAYDVIRDLADLRGRLLERLHDHVSRWEVPPLYGALARRPKPVILLGIPPEEEESDDWNGQVDGLERAVLRWTGTDAEVVDRLEAEIATGLYAEPTLRDFAMRADVFFGPHDWPRLIASGGMTRRQPGAAD